MAESVRKDVVVGMTGGFNEIMDILRTTVNVLSWIAFGFAVIFLLSGVFSEGNILLTGVVLAVIGGVLQGVKWLIRRK